MNFIDTILADLEALTEAEMSRALLGLQPVAAGEETLAVIEDQHVHRLWALGFEYVRRAQLAQHAAQFDASDRADREKLMLDYHRWDSMADVVRDIAWIEMRQIAGPKAWSTSSIGVREGFVLVTTPRPSEEHVASVPLSPMAARALGRLLGVPGDLEDGAEEKEPKKRKPS